MSDWWKDLLKTAAGYIPVVGPIASTILGSVLGSSGQQEPEQRRISQLTPEQERLFSSIVGQVQGGVDRGGISPYPGTQVPGTGDIMSRYLGMAGGGSDFAQDTGNVLSRAMSMKPLFGEDPGAVEEYWRKSMVDPAMSVFKKEVLPATREIYAGTGSLSSGGRYRAEAGAGTDLASNLGSMLTQALWGERTAARGEQQSAMTRAMSAIPLGGGIMDQLLRGGQVERDIAREPLTEEYQKWQMSQPYNNPWLGMGADLVKQRPGETYLQEQEQPWYSSFGKMLAGAGATGMGKQFAGWMGGTDEKAGSEEDEFMKMLKKLLGGGG